MVDVTTAARIEGGIVVGHDGSRNSTLALEWAARLAARLGEPLHVLRAWSMSNAPRPASFKGGYWPSLTEMVVVSSGDWRRVEATTQYCSARFARRSSRSGGASAGGIERPRAAATS